MGQVIKGRTDTAKSLATSHVQMEPDIQIIRRVVEEGEPDDGGMAPVKLLEVNPSTIPVGIQPVYFTPDAPNGILYATVIIEVTPEEYERIKQGDLSLPYGWSLRETLYERRPEAA